MTSDHMYPQRVSRELTLFRQPLHELLKSADVSLSQAQAWRKRGWLSFELDADTQYDQWHFEKIRFSKSLVDSGLGEVIAQHLLANLDRPYTFCATSVAYSFGHGQWVRVFEPPDVDQIIEDNWESWLASLADAGETERLAEIAQYVRGLIGSESGSAENKDKHRD